MCLGALQTLQMLSRIQGVPLTKLHLHARLSLFAHTQVHTQSKRQRERADSQYPVSASSLLPVIHGKKLS